MLMWYHYTLTTARLWTVKCLRTSISYLLNGLTVIIWESERLRANCLFCLCAYDGCNFTGAVYTHGWARQIRVLSSTLPFPLPLWTRRLSHPGNLRIASPPTVREARASEFVIFLCSPGPPFSGPWSPLVAPALLLLTQVTILSLPSQ